jgi:hypothetical protein
MEAVAKIQQGFGLTQVVAERLGDGEAFLLAVDRLPIPPHPRVDASEAVEVDGFAETVAELAADVVGAGGVEPPASSVSANGGEALCGPPFPQVTANRRGQS